MKIANSVWTYDNGWSQPSAANLADADAELVLVFGSPSSLKGGALADLRSRHHNAYIFGCSTAGEIADRRVRDDSVVATAIKFDAGRFQPVEAVVERPEDSFSAGRALAAGLPKEGLIHAFTLCDGLVVNGTDLVNGIATGLPQGVAVTGGLAGDGANFAETYVVTDGALSRKRAVMVGLYGDGLRVGFGSMGGWDPFGPERRITRSKGNILFELDGHSALALYKEYLGHHAAGLPASGLLFPLAIRTGVDGAEDAVVRTILGVDEANHSMTFAGDMPEGAVTQLMRANFDRLIDGASGAALHCRPLGSQRAPQLAILISCVGRKLVLKQRIEEEVESALDVLGASTVATGFYSYGEISPLAATGRCSLHNQTMTITTLDEAGDAPAP